MLCKCTHLHNWHLALLWISYLFILSVSKRSSTERSERRPRCWEIAWLHYLIAKNWIFCMEVYRSGHNEAVLKTVWVKAPGGSNPSTSANETCTWKSVGFLFAEGWEPWFGACVNREGSLGSFGCIPFRQMCDTVFVAKQSSSHKVDCFLFFSF